MHKPAVPVVECALQFRRYLKATSLIPPNKSEFLSCLGNVLKEEGKCRTSLMSIVSGQNTGLKYVESVIQKNCVLLFSFSHAYTPIKDQSGGREITFSELYQSLVLFEKPM
ncbi:hypothetical protein EGR_06914 [Echinococcus granulosus]|uniref:Uncharacterized protein n=1 Tax=Echinococcus granulosus TaxID=6210 RepID=W6UXJ5_ECHGR|nr:hypothetical protein EGR_06914 [Echinococcus granulosus]EUB58279.1 hypothetical protein EGR_06914 [Echinococcus granulosus]